MPKFGTLLIAFSLLFLSACKSDDDENIIRLIKQIRTVELESAEEVLVRDYEYDEEGRLLKVTRTSDQENSTNSFQYNSDGTVKQRTLQQFIPGASQTIRYDYIYEESYLITQTSASETTTSDGSFEGAEKIDLTWNDSYTQAYSIRGSNDSTIYNLDGAQNLISATSNSSISPVSSTSKSTFTFDGDYIFSFNLRSIRDRIQFPGKKHPTKIETEFVGTVGDTFTVIDRTETNFFFIVDGNNQVTEFIESRVFRRFENDILVLGGDEFELRNTIEYF